nr:hypothetical protein [uncultured Flavobacterium sp.]
MKKRHYIIVSGFLLFLFGFGYSLTDKKVVFQFLESPTPYIAGHTISLAFKCNASDAQPQLFIIHSYGKTVLTATKKGNIYFFEMPQSFSFKTGTVSWFLIVKSKTIQNGVFTIEPNDETKTTIENYLGPRTILAGGKEYTMLVTIPTDAYDNPKKDQTNVLVKYQFLENITTTLLKTNFFIAWYSIYSPTKSGKLLAASECENIATKEIETEIYPNIPTNFSISYDRNHSFADGNHFTKFSTSQIKDVYGNIVSDGTFVYFIIKTKNDYILKSFGATINGIATATILHPDHAEKYTVQGFVTGIAESNSVTINYTPVISTFNYQFSKDNRTLKVGPLKSFMKQLIPDGIKVAVKIYNKNTYINMIQGETTNGVAKFEFLEEFYPLKKYRFEITTMGITKKTKTLKYEPYKQ